MPKAIFRKAGSLVGIDEAGRGSLAGPVAVGVFVVKDRSDLSKFPGVKDSKQLSKKQRDEWFTRISEKGAYVVSFSGAKTIDKYGIVKAVSFALRKCLVKLEKKRLVSVHSQILLDGLLRAPAKYKNQRTIEGGDAKEPIIALASICAKVVRDRRMIKMAKKFPTYDFELHKGYGTKSHYKHLRTNGVCVEHRLTFL